MICHECKREVHKATFVKNGECAVYLCPRCLPRGRVYPLGVVTNKAGGYTVSPAYYDDITSRRSVYETDGRHVETGHKKRTHFVMGRV